VTTLVVLEICPVAPGDAQKYVDQITGNVLWGVKALFVIAAIVGIGAVVGGRLFSMPHASKLGVISLAVVFVAAIAYLVVPGWLDALLGTGCVPGPGSSSPGGTI
jgi:hypothetical protein